MSEGRGVTLVVDGHLDKRMVEHAFEAAGNGPRRERIRNGLEAAIDTAELDPEEARQALWALRRDRATLERLERCLDHRPARATFSLGAALQIFHDEFSSPVPDLRSRERELLHWLEGDW